MTRLLNISLASLEQAQSDIPKFLLRQRWVMRPPMSAITLAAD